jgi:hypothetical protein
MKLPWRTSGRGRRSIAGCPQAPTPLRRLSCQIQERSRRARRDELFSRSNDQDSDAGTFCRNVAVRRRALISGDVELDIEKSETSAQSFTYEGRPLPDPGREHETIDPA